MTSIIDTEIEYTMAELLSLRVKLIAALVQIMELDPAGDHTNIAHEAYMRATKTPAR